MIIKRILWASTGWIMNRTKWSGGTIEETSSKFIFVNPLQTDTSTRRTCFSEARTFLTWMTENRSQSVSVALDLGRNWTWNIWRIKNSSTWNNSKKKLSANQKSDWLKTVYFITLILINVHKTIVIIDIFYFHFTFITVCWNIFWRIFLNFTYFVQFGW